MKSTVEHIVGSTHFNSERIRDLLYLEAALGFVAVYDGSREGEITLLGYGDIPNTAGVPPEVMYSTTELSQVPSAQRDKVHLHGKGVGMRLYNTPHALQGLSDPPRQAGAYTVTLSLHPDRLLDTRKPSDTTNIGKATRILRHAGRMVAAQTKGLPELTDAIHQSYGTADAVLFSQPPLPRLREKRRGIHPPIPSEFIIIRNPALPIYGVGKCSPMA